MNNGDREAFSVLGTLSTKDSPMVRITIGHFHDKMVGRNMDQDDLVGLPDATWAGDTVRIWDVLADVARQHPIMAALGMWYVFAPNSHPLWAWHALSLVHLRDEEGLPSSKIAFAGATHELMCYAIDPASSPPDFAFKLLWKNLHPADFVQQFVAPDDELALIKVKGILETLVVPEKIVLDSDGRSRWNRVLRGEGE